MATRLFNFDDKEDRDIIEWLDNLSAGTKSAEVRAAIRDRMGKPKEPTLSEIIAELRSIKVQLERISSASLSAESSEEPQRAAKNLDDLLSRLESGEF